MSATVDTHEGKLEKKIQEIEIEIAIEIEIERGIEMLDAREEYFQMLKEVDEFLRRFDLE